MCALFKAEMLDWFKVNLATFGRVLNGSARYNIGSFFAVLSVSFKTKGSGGRIHFGFGLLTAVGILRGKGPPPVTIWTVGKEGLLISLKSLGNVKVIHLFLHGL